MTPQIQRALTLALRGQSIPAAEMQEAVGVIMDGLCSDIEIAALLTALAAKGETSEELAGAAKAMRARVDKLHSSRTGLMDTCGTGGDQLHTFNISTATAIVIAALGIPVAKHGNRSVSSSSGSADVLEQLGVNIELSADQAGKCLDDIGICFCYARLFHGAMKHVAPVRQELGIRTIFNLLGPLTNPASAQYQLLGTNSNASAEKLAQAASQLSIERAFIVCGNDQLDEVCLWGPTQVWDVQRETVTTMTWTPADFDLPPCTPDELKVSSASESADVIRRIFAGDSSPHRNIVIANAAAAQLCAGVVDSLGEGVSRATQALDAGVVATKLVELVEWTNQSG